MPERRIVIQKPALTPFNVVAGIIVVVGLVITVIRFTQGLGATTNLSDYNPWGIWIGFDLLVGVALAAGGYVTSAACYIFGLKRFHSAVRPAILTGFLGYALVVLALHYDVGRPWRLPYPFIVQSGTTSLLFEVAACVALYLTVLFIEFTPAALEWLGLKRARGIVVKLTLVLTIFGVVLSTLHQSSLGALFLIAPSKLHPLWYSPYLALYFFVSSIVAGLSMVIFEGSLAHKHFHDKMDAEHLREADGVALSFAKAALWFLVEMLGFVLLPCYFYAIGAREKNFKIIRRTAAWTVLGIVVNRFNVGLIAFNYHLPSSERYFPHWMEIGISVFVVTIGILVYKFIVTHMPILYAHPDYDAH